MHDFEEQCQTVHQFFKCNFDLYFRGTSGKLPLGDWTPPRIIIIIIPREESV